MPRRSVSGLAALALLLLAMLTPVLAPARAVVPGATGRIAFTSNRTGDFEIYAMNADGSGVTRLTDARGEDREPAWSPDGTKIVFVSYGGTAEGSSGDIMLMNADGTGLTNLTRFSGLDDEPAWSPDGTKIVWRTNRAGSDAEVFVMNADGTDPVQITNHEGVDDEPAWSPDGTKIVFRRCNPNRGSDAGHCSIAIANADGSDVTDIGKLTSGYKDDPAWSPDGAKIVFRSWGVDGEPDIFVIEAADAWANRVNLSNDADSDVDPAWAPDGTKIAYVRQPNGIPERTGNGEIWLMNADGTGQVNLTNHSKFDGDPDFQALPAGSPPTTSTTGPGPAPTTTTSPGPTPPATSPGPAGQAPAGRSGYWMVGSGGTVYAFGQARHLGDATLAPRVPAVDLEQYPADDGYWIVDRHGGVHSFGAAKGFGNAGEKLQAGEKVTSLSATPSGAGYWIFTDRGRALPFGDAAFHGDMTGVALNGPVLDSVPTPSGQGYYMVASDGGVFAFGDAHFAGSTGSIKLNAPVQSLVPDPDGAGYWLVASDGGVFAFDAPFRGSMGASRLNRPMTGMVAFGNGYLMVAEDGGIFNFSDRPFDGSLGATPPALPVVSVAALTS
jgi:Tol biopolymer transport system component